MTKFVIGITLTQQERERLGQNRSVGTAGHPVSKPLSSHICQVTLPDNSPCSVSYTRYNRKSHSFLFQAPVCQRLWVSQRLSGEGVSAIEAKAQELVGQAFRQAQAA